MIAFIGIAILGGYGAALWWLLRREGPWTFVALALLCGLSLSLRLVLTDAYPWGIAEDEPKVLACSVQALHYGAIFGESCIHIPYFLTSLFQAPLVPYFGANRWTIYWRIVLPLLKPAIATVMIIKGIAVYNEFYAPFLYLPSEGLISTSLFRFKGPFGAQWEVIAAGTIIVIVPTLIVFLLLQRWIYRGLTSGAVK